MLVGPPLMIVVAAATFWRLSHGGIGTITALQAYAESIDHPIAPLQDGRVLEVLVRIGAQVKAGDVLVKMDTAPLELEKQEAMAELAQARADLEAQFVIQSSAVARAELLVLKTSTQQTETKAQLAAAEQQLKRLEGMSEQQLVQARDVEESRIRQASLAASASVMDAAAREKQAGLGRGMKKSNTAADVQRRMAPFREEVKVKELAVKRIELAIENCSIRSRVDGVVSMIVFRAGDMVSAGGEIVRVTNGRTNYVVAWLSDRYANSVHPGDVARLRRVRLWSQSFQGRVVEMSPTVEEVPQRARINPAVPNWGRRVIIESSPAETLLLGETLYAKF